MTGKAFLVGAGPGSPDLITVRGCRLLRIADVIVHDRLVHPALLRHARTDARIVNAGKQPGQQGRSQDAISRLLVTLVQAGNIVVRLKGGDPFVFGRGGEECRALQEAGCPVEVVPGVSSATGVPTALGLPLTQRHVASDFAVITGHCARDASVQRTNWDALARMDTLVVLMGLNAVQMIQDRLLAAGKDPDTPALICSQGTWPEQRAVCTTLAQLAAAVRAEGLPGPGLMVIGPVVHYWQEHLAGQMDTEPGEVQSGTAVAGLPGNTDVYPLTLTRIRERKVLVAGGGPVGERKCRRLVAAGARVVLCSPALTPGLQEMVARESLHWHARRYQTGDLEGVCLAFAATNDPEVNRGIARDAAARNILCNVATDADGGDFRVPAVTCTEQGIIAVSSFAGNPRIAQRLRNQIQILLQSL